MSERNELPLNILVIDDEQPHAEIVGEALEQIGGISRLVFSQKDAVRIIAEQPHFFDVVVSDMMLEQPRSGMEVLQAVRDYSDETEVILMTGHASVVHAVEAMRLGAFNYLEKPLDLAQLRTVVEKAAESSRLRRVNLNLSQRLDEKFGFDGIIGASPQILAVIERLRRIAPTDATVLIQGETGTGKELFAQSLHQNSPRKNKPFVALNCAALSENILESELFGHVKGAFTDASSHRIGKFEYANGGTIFLDEVGDMPMLTQIKLLRVLENSEITRVGANETIKVNVRILSATNRHLEEAVESGRFRQDLYHRLKVVTIRIPTLQERVGDIPILLDYFVKMFAKKNHKTIKGIMPVARKRLLAYDWPGNVRELRNVVESMVVLDIDERLDWDDLPNEFLEPDELLTPGFVSSSSSSGSSNLPGSVATPNIPPDSLDSLIGRSLEEVERLLIAGTLEMTGGNREEAARILGIGERTLYRKIKLYEIV